MEKVSNLRNTCRRMDNWFCQKNRTITKTFSTRWLWHIWNMARRSVLSRCTTHCHL